MDGVTSAKHRFHPGKLAVSRQIRPYLSKCVSDVDFRRAGAVPTCIPFDVAHCREIPVTTSSLDTTVRERSAVRPADSWTVLPKTNQAQMAALPVPVAPTPRAAHRIVDAIDSYLTRLDDAVASLERAQAKLKAYRASVLKAAVEGRLVPTEAALARAEKRDYEPADVLLARILKERRRRWEEAELARLRAAGKTPKDDKWKAKYEEPLAPDTGRLPVLPQGWCWASAVQLAASEDYSLAIGPFGSNLKVDDYRASGVPLVFVRNVRCRGFRWRWSSAIREMQSKAEELRPHWVEAGRRSCHRKSAIPPATARLPEIDRRRVITADCVKLTPARRY